MTTGLYAADGSLNCTVVSGSSITGSTAANGSLNIIKAPGSSYVGAYHPCGALYVTLATGSLTGIKAPDGSLYVKESPYTGIGQKITVVSGTLHPGGGGAGQAMGLLLALTTAS